jgi:hypothetical protein
MGFTVIPGPEDAQPARPHVVELNAPNLTETRGAAPERPPEKPLPIWMQRTTMVIFVVFCIELGLFLSVLPWTPAWRDNNLLSRYPDVKDFLQHGFVRGAITGLGLVDIWVGIWEAAHYRDQR